MASHHICAGFLPERAFLRVSMLSLGLWLAASLSAQVAPKGPVHQLRVYEIFENNKAAFHERFRDHAIRIMEKYDFSIVAMWETQSEGRTEFVYILHWPDEATLVDRWARFMADEEWAEIKRKSAAAHGRLVGTIQERTLQLTDYSPRLP